MTTGTLSVLQGDITTLRVDAIVNAANRALAPGAGVDGAIRRAAGPALTEATRRIGGCETGQACITDGFDLPAAHVIHTVGPIWHGGAMGETELLAYCYRSCLALMRENRLTSIAFPAISIGIYGFPADQAAEIAVAEVRAGLADDENLEEVVLVAFAETDFTILEGAAGR
jgi:O-acetyl-ADP-ribose deacetylase (regulator of RNase III)